MELIGEGRGARRVTELQLPLGEVEQELRQLGMADRPEQVHPPREQVSARADVADHGGDRGPHPESVGVVLGVVEPRCHALESLGDGSGLPKQTHRGQGEAERAQGAS